MKLRMLRNPSKSLADSLGCKLKEGEVGDIKSDAAEELLRLRLAEPVEDSKPAEVNAVPPKPNVAKAADAEIGKQNRKS